MVRGAKEWGLWVEGMIGGEINPQLIREELRPARARENLTEVDEFKTVLCSHTSSTSSPRSSFSPDPHHSFLYSTFSSDFPLALSIKEFPSTQISVK